MNYNKELIEKIKTLSNRSCWYDEEDFNAMENSGGNFDDAYWSGVEDGMIRLAREIQDATKEREQSESNL